MKSILQQNKDLDLRRYGKEEYTKALKGGGSSEGHSSCLDPFVVYPDALLFEDVDGHRELVDTTQSMAYYLRELNDDSNGVSTLTPLYEDVPWGVEFDGESTTYYSSYTDKLYLTTYFGFTSYSKHYSFNITKVYFGDKTYYFINAEPIKK